METFKAARLPRPLKDNEKFARFVDGNTQITFEPEQPIVQSVYYSNRKKEDGTTTDFMGVTLSFKKADRRITVSLDRIYATASEALKPLVMNGKDVILNVRIGYTAGNLVVQAL